MKRFDKPFDTNAKKKVLVVEDVYMNRQMLVESLKGDYTVLEAENGRVGLELLEKNYEDLAVILLDVVMPEIDGYEFLRQKKADGRFDSVPVIVATSSKTEKDEIACLELGANDFVGKPYNFGILLNRVKNIINLRESAALVNQLSVDRTTGLGSKEYFLRAVQDVFAAEGQDEYDIMCSGVTNLKAVNDRYGEENCDIMLHDLADRLLDIVPGIVTAGRIGGGSFAFLIEHQEPGWEDVLYTAADGISLKNVNVKFGIVPSVDRNVAVSKLCNRAITAYETAKDLHGINVTYFDDKMLEQQDMEQTVVESMQAALDEHQFTVVFQPKHDVSADKVGGAEALVRWTHPEIGFISPGWFVPIFERNGFITKLDMYVWEEVCKQIKRNADLGLPPIPISANASRHDFDVPDLPARIAALADKYGIDRSLLHIELTETAYSDNPEAVTRTLQELKRLGFFIELDDFGTGYSSLVSLNTLPLDVMKLDMSMVQKATELNDFRIIESTIKLAQVLGLKTVVEGVETAEEAAKIKEIGGDFIQGYYYSRPLGQADFEAYLRA